MNPLLLLIIFFIFSKEDKKCKIISKITEKSEQDRMYYDYCVYIDTNEFNNFEDIIIEANVDGGVINERFLYYGETSDEPIKDSYVTLTKTQTYFEWRMGKKIYFLSNTNYYFKKPETIERYLVVACPEFVMSTCCCEISFFIEMSSLAISLIVIGSIIFVAVIVIIIIICLVKRKKKKSLLFHSDNDFSSLTDDYSSSDKEDSKPINDNSSSINDNLPNFDDLPPPPSTDYPTNKYTPNSSIYK